MKLIAYVEGDSFLHKLDPRAKFCLITSIILLSFTFNDPLYLLGLLITILLMSAISGIFSELVVRAKPLIPVVIMSFILWTLFYRWSLFGARSGSKIILSVGPIIVDEVGLSYGLAMPIRVLILILAPLMFIATTKMYDVVLFLTKIGMPYKWAFMFGMSMKLVSVLAGEFITIRQAQASRGLEMERGGLAKRARSYAPVLIPFLVKSMDLSDKLGMAMAIRGFGYGDRRTFYRNINMRPLDYVVVLLALISLCLGIILRSSGVGVVI